MASLLLRVFAFAVSCSSYGAESLELTAENWKEHTGGKIAFVKFFAPWCGHCKKIKPAWDRLMLDFKDSTTAVVAEVDCTANGKSLCTANGVKGYPSLMWGKAADPLKPYNGQRSYEDFRRFAQDNLGESCGPGLLALCDEKRRALLEKFMRIPPEKLDERIGIADQQIKRAEYNWKLIEHNVSLEMQASEEKKRKKITSIRKKNELPQAANAGAVELTPTNWEEHVADKTVFIKFFAPWCGHCKALKPAWDRLTSDFEGTTTALVAEVDCTGKGKQLCDKYDVTGFPRLLWGKVDDLQKYFGGREYEEMKRFADDHLGKPCGPSNLELCSESHRAVMENYGKMSPEKRESKAKAAEKAIEKANKAYDEAHWNFLAKLDTEEMKKDKQVKTIKDQGLDEAKLVQEWNRKQPEGFWKPPGSKSASDDPLGFLQETAFSLAGHHITWMTICILLFAFVCLFVIFQYVLSRRSLPPTCKLRHIVTATEEEILKAKERLASGEVFEEVAKECSTCPSHDQGGDLGLRPKGSMSPSLDEVCFNPATKLGTLLGPIKTKYGYHLVIVDSRKGIREITEQPEEKRESEKKED
mmetsp:Transcript_53578/g.96243  ORF Transcript_53578/g.96243 Transcript_53578/m.96243 type:complete len:585 (-) Transcript_53578:39-1793(-)